VTVDVDDHGDKINSFRFGAPHGRPLKEGKYGGAAGRGAESNIMGPYGAISLGSDKEFAAKVAKINPNSVVGIPVEEFVVWEMDLKDPNVPHLAIDFIVGEGVCGSLRVNSRFKLAMPEPKRWDNTK
jgi:hypothetical protein